MDDIFEHPLHVRVRRVEKREMASPIDRRRLAVGELMLEPVGMTLEHSQIVVHAQWRDPDAGRSIRSTDRVDHGLPPVGELLRVRSPIAPAPLVAFVDLHHVHAQTLSILTDRLSDADDVLRGDF